MSDLLFLFLFFYYNTQLIWPTITGPGQIPVIEWTVEVVEYTAGAAGTPTHCDCSCTIRAVFYGVNREHVLLSACRYVGTHGQTSVAQTHTSWPCQAVCARRESTRL